MARLLALCSLPRTNPGNRIRYVRRNGPYTLGMTAGVNNKLPFGNLPRLILAWVCTEVVKTGRRELILGSSLSEVHGQAGHGFRRRRSDAAPQPDAAGSSTLMSSWSMRTSWGKPV